MRTIAGVVVGLTLAAGCGGGTGDRSTTAAGSRTAAASGSAASTTTRAAGHPPRPRRPAGAPVGAPQRVRAGGSTLSVTVVRVLDPLPPGVAAPVPGTRAAGVEVTIRNLAGGDYDSTASGDWSVTTRSGPGSPLFVRSGACRTPLVDFESLIGSGQTRSGCVAFSLPRRQRIVSIRFSPHARRGPATVSWRGSGG